MGFRCFFQLLSNFDEGTCGVIFFFGKLRNAGNCWLPAIFSIIANNYYVLLAVNEYSFEPLGTLIVLVAISPTKTIRNTNCCISGCEYYPQLFCYTHLGSLHPSRVVWSLAFWAGHGSSTLKYEGFGIVFYCAYSQLLRVWGTLLYQLNENVTSPG
jgi:hypothetical protein